MLRRDVAVVWASRSDVLHLPCCVCCVPWYEIFSIGHTHSTCRLASWQPSPYLRSYLQITEGDFCGLSASSCRKSTGLMFRAWGTCTTSFAFKVTTLRLVQQKPFNERFDLDGKSGQLQLRGGRRGRDDLVRLPSLGRLAGQIYRRSQRRQR